jgi:pimeloyl-ACP methyl ester carboxylesterase
MPTKRKIIWTLGVCLVLSLPIAMAYCKADKTPAQNARRVAKVFKNEAVKPQIKYYNVGSRHISTLQIGNDSLPLTVFLHGSPGSGADYDDYLKDSTLYQKSKLVVIDRPGYGFSDYGREELSIVKQAEIVQNVVRQIGTKHKINWVGYSYGGPVAARLAAIMPEQTNGLLLISASIAPRQEKIFKISYFLDKKWVKDEIPTFLRLANDEKLSHTKALQEISQDWNKITAKTYIVHGEADDLIYYENAAYCQKMMTNAQLEVMPMKGEGHGFFFSNKVLISIYLKKLLQQQITNF